MPALTLASPILSGHAVKDTAHFLTRNRLLPILQLCHDIVEYILLLAAGLERSTRSLRRSTISYSQTCHDWRLIALSVKPLWSRLVDFENRPLEWNEEMLSRSNPLPIRLSFHSHYARNMTALRAQLEHLHRVQTYSIGCCESNWGELTEGLKRPAPQIRSLYIICYRTDYASNSAPILLPASLFANYAPRLSHLELRECLPDFYAPVLASLTSLRIIDVELLNAPTAFQWLEHLTRMPNLTMLLLEGAIRSSRDDHPSTPPAKSRRFPLISDLYLDAPLQDVGVLLQNLPVRLGSRWSVTCVHSQTGPDLDAVMRKFATGISTLYEPDDPCPLLLAAHDSDIYLRSEIYTAAESLCPAGFSVNFRLPRSSFWDALFPAVAAHLADVMQRVSALELHLPYVHPAVLPCLHRGLQIDTLVKFSSTMTHYLLPKLQSPLPSTGAIPLPALRTIIFTDDKSMWGANYRALLDFLRWRAMMGTPVERIYFVDCLVLDDTMEELAGMGVVVVNDEGVARWQNL
ncbi:hypothetical protein M413DRAFT_433874 [Hebeloma cylindrosporum]|uniref:F-box domain-containing protein n=1 Tax=Hebeloma cylindrosporum TaxID=76867 RepID=A0A0C3BU60_HEBCY|nr:hypothetical protein M413DRAFT_433874 [Hebeloma cylindrosporum h7]